MNYNCLRFNKYYSGKRVFDTQRTNLVKCFSFVKEKIFLAEYSNIWYLLFVYFLDLDTFIYNSSNIIFILFEINTEDTECWSFASFKLLANKSQNCDR